MATVQTSLQRLKENKMVLGLSDAQKLVGKTAKYIVKTSSGTLEFDIIIKSWSPAYGKDRFLVTPVNGSGEIWTEHIKIKETK